MSFYKRLAVVLAVVGVLGSFVMLFAMDVIKLDWITFMEIQPSYKPMESPRPVAARSIPIEGAAYIAGQGVPENPVVSDDFSVERGKLIFSVTCAHCHGAAGDGTGVIAGALVFPPANLTSELTQSKPDGSLFLTISNGIQGAGGQIHMPALNEDLSVRDRWDLVNYIRTLKATPAP